MKREWIWGRIRVHRTLFELSSEQQRILNSEGNLLVLGGPGSGKTTVAILKAGAIARDRLRSSQKVIFLSFARPTVARIIEALDATSSIAKEDRRSIEVDTYHAFFWRVIRSHGYLLGLPRRLSLLAPAAEAVALSAIRNEYDADAKLTDEIRAEKRERERALRLQLAYSDGKICFDLFAETAGQILNGSQKIRKLVSEAYPFVVLDEFQDTDPEQWNVVKAIGRHSELIALADPEQRIYEFIGADPERIDHYKNEVEPSEFDLSDENYRSASTDIAKFGNDVLSGTFSRETYDGILLVTFSANKNQALATLKGQVLQARKRMLEEGNEDWCVAVLVPTRKMTRAVSDYLRSQQSKLPPIDHTASVEVEAVILAAEVISFLLQPKEEKGDFRLFVRLLRNYYEGRGGASPTKTHIKESLRIGAAFDKAAHARKSNKAINKSSLILPMLRTYRSARKVELTGDPDHDWVALREKLEGGTCKRLRDVALESRNLRLLNRGTQLRLALSQAWRESMSYPGALEIVRTSFVQEHFARSSRPETGVVVMNMHKAKGKQFDEVIIFEGWPRFAKGKMISNPDRIVLGNDSGQDLSQSKQNFRVSITRAKKQTTILTPEVDPCCLLL